MEKNETQSNKIIKRADFSQMRQEYRERGVTVAHCHGVFDLIHPGHISHLEQAKRMGDILVVSVTSSPYVNKGPGRPYFNDELRMNTLAALSCVDHVLLSESAAALDILEIIQPDWYIKGKEYDQSENDITANIDKEIAMVRKYGGEIKFTDGAVFSSTRLINSEFKVLPAGSREFLQNFARQYRFNDIQAYIERLKALRVLVVGDIIIDQYIFCQIQGLTSKDRAFSAVFEKEETYPGGVLAIARHLASFCGQVKICSIAGNEQLVMDCLDALPNSVEKDLISNKEFSTTIKRRYINQHGIRNDYDKVFSINHINDDQVNTELEEKFMKCLHKNMADVDVVILADFGHGLINQKIIDMLEHEAPFLAVNCQTNSSNYGMNVITKYERADTFTLDSRELRLAFNNRTDENSILLKRLRQHLGSRSGWLTLGSLGAIGIGDKGSIISMPAFTLNVKDTVGAGDAFFALASICSYLQLPLEIGTFLGNLAGALAANVMGNSQAVDRVSLLKYASTLLNV